MYFESGLSTHTDKSAELCTEKKFRLCSACLPIHSLRVIMDSNNI